MKHDFGVARPTALVFATVFLALFGLATLARIVVPDLLAMLSPDSLIFEEEARALALQIEREGWSVWLPAPNQQTPTGLLAASMAVFGDTLVPIIVLNAALLAGAAAATVNVVSRLLPSPRWAALGAVAFLLPSIVMVTAVPHKDPFAIFGAACVLLGFTFCVRFGSDGGLARLVLGLALAVLGAMGFWFVRPYAIVLMLGAAGLCASVLLLGSVPMLVRRQPGALLAFARTSGALALAIVALFLVSRAPTLEGLQETSAFVAEISDHTQIPLTYESPPVAEASSTAGDQCPISLPAALERRLGFLLATRQAFKDCCADASTAIDNDRALITICDLAAYLPRAVAIGHLAPFPTEWIVPGRSLVAAIAVATEMSLLYVALAGALVGAWFGRTRETLAMLAFCVGLVVVLAIAFPNVGTLYRMRLPYLLPIMALGLSALASIAFARKE